LTLTKKLCSLFLNMKIILDLSKHNVNARRAISAHIQQLLFLMGLFWGSNISAPKDSVRYTDSEALVVGRTNREKEENPKRKWNHIFKHSVFNECDKQIALDSGALVFDGSNVTELFQFFDAVHELIISKNEDEIQENIDGVDVNISIDGVVIDFTSLLSQVQAKAKARWESEFQRG